MRYFRENGSFLIECLSLVKFIVFNRNKINRKEINSYYKELIYLILMGDKFEDIY